MFLLASPKGQMEHSGLRSWSTIRMGKSIISREIWNHKKGNVSLSRCLPTENGLYSFNEHHGRDFPCSLKLIDVYQSKRRTLMSRIVRVFAMASLVLTLISWGFGISAILHPVSCPGAFIGCSE